MCLTILTPQKVGFTENDIYNVKKYFTIVKFRLVTLLRKVTECMSGAAERSKKCVCVCVCVYVGGGGGGSAV